MAWTRGRIAYDLIGHITTNIPLMKRFAARQNYANNFGTARALCNSYGYALLPIHKQEIFLHALKQN